MRTDAASNVEAAWVATDSENYVDIMNCLSHKVHPSGGSETKYVALALSVKHVVASQARIKPAISIQLESDLS